MVIRTNPCSIYPKRFLWNRFGFLLITRSWIIATKVHAFAWEY